MKQLTANVWREGEHIVAQCLELGIASEGDTPEQALANLCEALELFLEAAGPDEQVERLRQMVTTACIEVADGQTAADE
jgi:predicted RNase H-like HicB family nuclease